MHRSILLALALLAGVPLLGAAARAQGLLLPGPGTDPKAGLDPSVRRGRSVDIDLALLDRVQAGDVLRLELFPGESVDARFESKQVHFGRWDNYTWTGTLDGLEGSRFGLTRVQDSVAATIEGGAHFLRHLSIVPEQGRTFVRERIEDPSARCGCGAGSHNGPTGSHGVAATASAEEGGVDGLLSCDNDDPNNITIVVAYDQSAVRRAGSSSAVEATIRQAIVDANDAFGNSAGVTLWPTRIAPVSFSSTNNLTVYEILDFLRNRSDGVMDEVHTWRTQDVADLVTLVYGDYYRDSNGNANIGLANLPTAYSDFEYKRVFRNGGMDIGFSISVYDFLAGPYWTMAHELGHNFGCQHDDANVGSTLLASYGRGYFAYESRWPNSTVDRIYKTLMSYPSSYPSCQGLSCEQWSANTFSSPNGYANGIAMGDASHDNARLLRETKQYVANYSNQVQGHFELPVILVQPQAATLCSGYYSSPVTVMSVTAENVATFQWYKDGLPMNGQTSSSLRFQGVVDSSYQGDYFCRLRSCNRYDSVTSTAVTLTIDTNCRPSTIANSSSTRFENQDLRLVDLGDVNGDGYNDLGLGQPNHSTSVTGIGRFEVFSGLTLGRIAGVNGGAISFTHMGEALAGVDLNGDGLNEVLVGVPGLSEVQTFRGGRNGLGSYYSFRRTAGFGRRLAAAKFIGPYGGGFFVSDAAHGIHGFHGITGRWTIDTGYEVKELCTIGDVNGDGDDDVAAQLVLAPNRLHVYSGRDGTELWSTNAVVYVPHRGMVATGDVNRDGIPDIALAGSGFPLRILSGANGAVISEITRFATSHKGISLSGGDADGDGLQDLVVSISTTEFRVLSSSTGATLGSYNNYNGYVFLGMDIDGDSRGEFIAQPIGPGSYPDNFLAILGSPEVRRDPGRFLPYGTRCLDSASRRVTLDVTDPILPRIAQSVTLQLSGVSAGVPASLLLGFQRQSIDLDPIGIPCDLYTELYPIATFATTANRTDLTIPIPDDLLLVGGRVMVQMMVHDPGATSALPLVLSNGGELTIGYLY